MRKIVPINDFVVVRKEDIVEKRTSSGLIIPVTKKQQDVDEFPVQCVSDKCEYVVGEDRVVFPMRMGTPFEVDGVEYIAINERNIMCKLIED